MALIDLIKQLRDRTGAGLMDCKAALLNNDEDLDKATDWLREKGLAKAAKKADRIAAEGLALTKTCEKCGCTVILEVNCETDFVAKGDAFKELVDNVAGVILKNEPKDVEAAKALTTDLFTDATVKMGEKFDLRRFEVIEKEVATHIFSIAFSCLLSPFMILRSMIHNKITTDIHISFMTFCCQFLKILHGS